MSADNDPKAVRDGDYRFAMPQAIPSYLMAIAAGDLVFRPINERAGVWAETLMADKAAKEFEDTGKMIDSAEALYGPYRWGRYDILVLPPSFPYGGMENPRLTFARKSTSLSGSQGRAWRSWKYGGLMVALRARRLRLPKSETHCRDFPLNCSIDVNPFSSIQLERPSVRSLMMRNP